MLQIFCFLVNFVPRHPKHLDQEEFDDPVATEYAKGMALAFRTQSNALAGLMVHKTLPGQCFDHGCGRAWSDAKASGQSASGDQLVPNVLLLDEQLLEIVFDCL